jgi:hypothetical protein
MTIWSLPPPHRTENIKMASNQPNIERQQAMTLRPGQADATFAAKPASSGPRWMPRSLQHQ